jgi:uncharacterized protein (TIGR00369 family)
MILPHGIMPLTPGRWEREPIIDSYAQNCEPIYRLDLDTADEPVRFGFLVERRHCNRIDSCHGGMLATFLDFALGTVGKTACTDDIPTPTITLSIDYLQPALAGEWVETRSRLVHATRGMFFIEGSAVTANGPIARANAIYKRLTKT